MAMRASRGVLRCLRVSRVCGPVRLAPLRPLRVRFSTSSARESSKPPKQPVDDPDFVSILDAPPQIVRTGSRIHGSGLILLALIPITAFALGTWQVQRLGWKTELLAKLEDRLVREPLPLPPHVDPAAVHEFDYRRVLVTGHLRHDQEMLIGPRMRDGNDGYLVVTPLDRSAAEASTILVNRGWISKKRRDQRSRPESLPHGRITVEGLLREPWKKNMFTPENKPEKSEFYFPDVEQMAALTGSQPVWIEATTACLVSEPFDIPQSRLMEIIEPDFVRMADYEARGIPIGKPAEINLRNNHAQYIFTWYGLCIATSVMFCMLVKKPVSGVARGIQMSGRR